MEPGDLIRFIIQERVAYFCSSRKKEKPEELQAEQDRLDQWEEFLKSNSSEVQKTCQEYLNWLMEQQGKELEDCYLLGVQDGIRLMKTVQGV